MSIEVSCECAMTYRLPDRFAGKRCRCRECGDSIRVPALDESSSEDEESEAKPAPAKAAKKRPLVRADSEHRGEQGRRPPTQPSESLHQMAPLNLSESRCLDPPAARARIKKAKAKAAEIKAKKRSSTGPASESEIEVAPRKKGKLEKRAKKKKSAKKALEKKRYRYDDDGEDDRPAKKKGKKKARRPGGAAGRDAPRAAYDDEDEDFEGDEDDDAPFDWRAAKKRQQKQILIGSLAACGVVVLLLVILIVHGSAKEAAIAQKVVDVRKRMSDANEMAKKDISQADKLYGDTITLIDDKAIPLPEEDADLNKEISRFRARRSFFEKVKAAQTSDDFINLCWVEDEVIRTAGLEKLVASGDPRCADVCGRFANDASPAVKQIARKGLLQSNSNACDAILDTIIREDGPTGPLGKLAVERALNPGAAPNFAAYDLIAEKDRDPQHLLALLSVLCRNVDSKGIPIAEKLAKSADPEVQKAAEKTLAELKGFEPARKG